MGAVRVLKGFSLFSALLWVGITLFLALSLTYYVERLMFRETSLASLDYIQALTQRLPTDTELKRFRREIDHARMESVLAPLRQEQKIVTIKLYDKSGRLIYHSRSIEQEGKIFPHNPNLKMALSGKRTLTVSDLSHPEHIVERELGFDRLLELYIPIRDSQSGSVSGAYEIYTSLGSFYTRIWRQRMVVWGIVLTGALLLYAGLFILFRKASQTIIGQSREIEEKAENLEKTIAELKSTQTELIRSERLATVGQLAAGVAHEVGNPLASIMGMVDLLLRQEGNGADRDEDEEYLNRIGSEVMRLKGIIRALLDYARPAKANLGPLDLNMLVEKTLPLFQMQKNFRSINLREELSESSPCALADEALVQQILLNLLLNAGQSLGGKGGMVVRTSSGGAGSIADLRLGPLPKGERGVCVLEVQDDGPGISPEFLPRIFEPFETTRVSSEGAGLGLAVCLRLVEELKGAIEVESRLEGGATFRIFLPGANVAAQAPRREQTSVG